MGKVVRLVACEGCRIGLVGGWLGKLKFNSSVPAGKVGEGGEGGGGGGRRAGLALTRPIMTPALGHTTRGVGKTCFRQKIMKNCDIFNQRSMEKVPMIIMMVAMIIMMIILMIMMTRMTKKHTNIKIFG